MRNTLLAISVAALPFSLAWAEPPDSQKWDKLATPEKTLPLKGAATGNSCAAYGPGFIKLEGTDTCVKAGGAIRIDAGSSSVR